MKKTLIIKIFIAFLLTALLATATVITWVYSQIDSALPTLNGKQTLFGLSNTATVERDAQGIATITAQNRTDVAVATGFIHAQERFFQMDLLRKNAAGELSSLFGKVALDYDKEIRLHRFRDRAREIVKQLPAAQFDTLQAYTRGVNQGLSSLKAAPFEYLLLQQSPAEWQEEDTILTVLSMYLDLQYHDGRRERTLAAIHNLLGSDVYQFLNPKGSIWDAAIDDSQFTSSPIPASDWSTLSQQKIATTSSPLFSISPLANTPYKTLDKTLNSVFESSFKKSNAVGEQFPGSNNWAVSGNLTTTKSAIVANDMHLGIRVPNIWFRASFNYLNKDKNITVTGLTLPGTPNMIVGSNTDIAWGFTNSYGDWSDVIVLKTNDDGSQYLTPQGYKPFTYHKQMIAVKDQESVEIKVKETQWGPVIGKNANEQLLAYRWVAHDINSVNLNQIKLEAASNVDEAFVIAASAGMPAQNLMVADAQGNIGWTIMGPIPAKKGDVGELPQSWSTGDNTWQGYLAQDQYPRVKNPNGDRLWTANSRVVGGEMYEKLGNGGYALGARSRQIRNALQAKETFNEKDLLTIALDDKAVFLQRWQQLLIEQVLTSAAVQSNDTWQTARKIVLDNNLQASTDSVAYRLVRRFRLNVRYLVFNQLNTQLTSLDPAFNFKTIRHQVETPLWQLVTLKPSQFLLKNTKFTHWQQLFTQALNMTLEEMTKEQPLIESTWGKLNTTNIVHPLSKAVPFIGRWLDMPHTPLSGDAYMPKVQGKAFGASQRMIVSPGNEENGILHMPTSQSGHPWSPYYGMGHADWEAGNPSAFLPGKTKYTLTFYSF